MVLWFCRRENRTQRISEFYAALQKESENAFSKRGIRQIVLPGLGSSCPPSLMLRRDTPFRTPHRGLAALELNFCLQQKLAKAGGRPNDPKNSLTAAAFRP